jgi:hypothetical protein
MNERIQELAEQAEKYADDNFKGEPFWTEAYESKFAELIIIECVREFVRKTPVSVNVSNRARHVFKHFGIKECMI